jgi:lysozyme
MPQSSDPQPKPTIQPQTPAQPVVGRKLTALVGASAAALLLSQIPLSESSRKVVTQVTADKQVVIVKQDPFKYMAPYLDIAGVRTACDGLTGAAIPKHGVLAPSQCQTLLEAALDTAAAAVEKCSPIDGNKYPAQVYAYVDFAYNLGGGAWCQSSARRAVLSGNLTASCDLLLLYNKARVHGRLVPVADLTRRRHRERAYCQTGLVPGATQANLAVRLRGT